MENRFQELLQHIKSAIFNKTGVVGKWIKAIEHNSHYDKAHPGHGDMKGGWNWWEYSNQQAQRRPPRILKFKVGKYVYWVNTEYELDFKQHYPLAKKLFP